MFDEKTTKNFLESVMAAAREGAYQGTLKALEKSHEEVWIPIAAYCKATGKKYGTITAMARRSTKSGSAFSKACRKKGSQWQINIEIAQLILKPQNE